MKICEAHRTQSSYSRGYKNRAIVKKLFEFSPIFYEGIEGKLFMLMRFFNSSKDLTCMLGSFFSQSVHAAVAALLFLLTAIFYKMLSKNTARCIEKISMSQKVRLMA